MIEWCINLARRQDRWKKFEERIIKPIAPHTRRFDAFDGKDMEVSLPWQSGAYACMMSHLTVWRHGLADGSDIMVWEDDAEPLCGLHAMKEIMPEPPPMDWDMVYFGGQLLNKNLERIDFNWRRALNINRMHAYAVRAKFLPTLIKHVAELDWGDCRRHVDHRVGQLHADHRVYIPNSWLFGQARGKSDITGFTHTNHSWQHSTD